MNAILSDLIRGGVRALLAILWMKHSWPARHISPENYISEAMWLADKKTAADAVESSIWKWLVICSMTFLVWGICAVTIDNITHSDPGIMFYIQNAICIVICLMSSAWIMKYFSKTQYARLMSRQQKRAEILCVSCLGYSGDIQEFTHTFKTAVDTWEQWNYDSIGVEVNHQIAMVMKANCDMIYEQTDPLLRAKALENAENLIGDMVRIAHKFGICTTINGRSAIEAGLLAITAQEMKKK